MKASDVSVIKHQWRAVRIYCLSFFHSEDFTVSASVIFTVFEKISPVAYGEFYKLFYLNLIYYVEI